VNAILLVLVLAIAQTAPAQELRIGTIDFYGLQRLSPTAIRAPLTFKEGDIIDDDMAALRQSEERGARADNPGAARRPSRRGCARGGGRR
jgi:hypothetical protein